MEGAVSDVGICNLAYAGRLEELRAQLLRDRALATKADQVSRLRPSLPAGARAGGLRARFPPGGSCHTQPPSPRFPAHRRSLLPSGQPDRAALGLLGGTHGRRRPPPRPGRARERQGRCECRGHPGTPPLPPREGPARGSGRLGKCCDPVCVGNLVAQFLSGAFAVTVSAAEVPLASGPVAAGAGRFLLPSVGVSSVVSGGVQNAHTAVCALGRQAEVFRCLCGRGGNETWMSPACCQGSLGELFLRTKLQNQGALGCSRGFSCYLYLGVILLNML